MIKVLFINSLYTVYVYAQASDKSFLFELGRILLPVPLLAFFFFVLFCFLFLCLAMGSNIVLHSERHTIINRAMALTLFPC